MSFANAFTRARRGLDEEIAYYRSFAALDGIGEPLAALEELREKWIQRSNRYAGRGRAPTEPFDWREDQASRASAKESMSRIIKAAAVADESAAAAADDVEPAEGIVDG